MKIMANKQRGFSFSSFLVAVVIVLVAAIIGMKLIPAYMQDAKIKNIFDIIVHDPEMQNAPVNAIRTSYARRASIDAITAVSEQDIDISKDKSGISLSASYAVKIKLGGNASLVLEFNPSSSK
jgi:ABC-type Na+ efflux pump permease subunit